MSHLKSILLLVISLGVWQIAAANSDAGTLLVGVGMSTTCSPNGLPFPYLFGYSNSPLPAAGSYSPTGLTGGETVIDLFDYFSCGTRSELVISGFSANPGQSWLSSVKCGSVTNTGSSATYYYGSGDASWVWSTRFGLQSSYGSNVSCTIVHN